MCVWGGGGGGGGVEYKTKDYLILVCVSEL